MGDTRVWFIGFFDTKPEYPNNSSKSAINLVDKGLYVTMKRWRIDPSFVAWNGYLLSFKIRESKFSRNFSPVFFAFSK